MYIKLGSPQIDSERWESSRPVQTLQRSQQLSRKLKRRLTQRTLTEARALQKQSKEAIHVLIYAAELVSISHRSFHFI